MLTNTINIVNPNSVENAYRKRNALYKLYMEDVIYKSLVKLTKRDDIDSLLMNSLGIKTSMYQDAISLAVTNKFKYLTDAVKQKSNSNLFTLEPIDPSLVETNMNVLENGYLGNDQGFLSRISPVSKEVSNIVEGVTFNLLNFIRNDISKYANEFIAEVKQISNNGAVEVDDKINMVFIEVNELNKVILDEGIISTHFSNNFQYQFTTQYDARDFIKIINDTNLENVDLNNISMGIDSEFHKYLEELEETHIEDFKDKVNDLIDENLTVKPFINKLTDSGIMNLRDLQFLSYLWVSAVTGYKRTKDDMFLNIGAYIEQLMHNAVVRIEQLKANKKLAVGKKNGDSIDVYIVLKEYLTIIEKYQDIAVVIKGFFSEANSNTLVLSTDQVDTIGYDNLVTKYERYMSNLRYKQILSRIGKLRDSYVYGFVKTNDTLLTLLNKNYETRDKIKKLVEEYILTLKLDDLLDIEGTVYNIVKNFLYSDLFKTVEGFIKVGEDRFSDDEDSAIIFAIILTLTEVTFSLFNVKLLDRVD